MNEKYQCLCQYNISELHGKWALANNQHSSSIIFPAFWKYLCWILLLVIDIIEWIYRETLTISHFKTQSKLLTFHFLFFSSLSVFIFALTAKLSDGTASEQYGAFGLVGIQKVHSKLSACSVAVSKSCIRLLTIDSSRHLESAFTVLF